MTIILIAKTAKCPVICCAISQSDLTYVSISNEDTFSNFKKLSIFTKTIEPMNKRFLRNELTIYSVPAAVYSYKHWSILLPHRSLEGVKIVPLGFF